MQTRDSDTTGYRSRPRARSKSKSKSRSGSVRSRRLLPALLLAGVLALTGCTGADDTGSAGSGADKAAPAQEAGSGAAGPGADGTGGAKDSGGERAAAPGPAVHIVRTASLTVRVEDVSESLAEVRAVVAEAGGVIGDETTDRDSGGRERSRVVLRVPADAYEEVLDELEGAGRLIDRRAKAEDVTEQVVDVRSRITSQRASVARIRELMDRASELSDVVTLEGELSTRQADLESLLARQAALKDRTSLATITLSLSQHPVKEAAGDDGPGFTDALGGGWDAFVTLFRWIALAVGATLPFLVGAALLLFLWMRFLRGRTPRGAAGAGGPEGERNAGHP